MTPDSQKSGLDKASESVTSTGDKLAGAVQPGTFLNPHYNPRPRSPARALTRDCLGDSKSTAQELSDTTRSYADKAQDQGKGLASSAQDTGSDLYNKASESAPSGGDAQGTAKSYLQTAQDKGSDLYNQAAKNAPSSADGKSYLETAQEYASSAAETVSKTVSGMSRYSHFPISARDSPFHRPC